MKRYLFLKLGLTILVIAAASPRTQVQENFTSNRDVNKQSSNNHHGDQPAGSSSQQGDPKTKLEDYQGVMGKPGVDFPILTYIPRTGFNCRGKKSGYYADLETNCQVFHICEEGRKVSFLCPNGTIFQQSDLICDWWFKVDCATAPTLYEESAEQLYEENIRRKENRRVLEQERRTSKINQRKSVVQSRENQNYVKKDTTQYTSHRNDNHHSREETQIPSETASFVNNRYNSEQQKKYFKSINDVSDDSQTYDYSTTEKIVSRGSRTYSSSFTTKYRNQVPDLVKTTTQHTIYSPTVPPFTSTRYTTKAPITAPFVTSTQEYKTVTTKAPFTGSVLTSQARTTVRAKPVPGFYITKPFSTFAPPTGVTELFSQPLITSTPFTSSEPYTNSPVSYTNSPVSYTNSPVSYTNSPVAYTNAPVVYTSSSKTDSNYYSTTNNDFTNNANNDFTSNDFSITTEQNILDVSTTVLPFEDATVKNTIVPSIPTPFKSRSNIEYLPKSNNTKISTPKPTIPTEYTTTAPSVTENLSNMIKTLEEIDTNADIDLDKQISRPGLNIPPSAGPKTLHSLAIYFATALDNLVTPNENTTDSTTVPTTIDDTEVTLLSRNTQVKYNSLFDEQQVVDNSTEEINHETTDDIDLRSLVEHDAHYNDLDPEQSRGPVSSTPRIRQLAQVFTQALSAYLNDPDTFKKVLEEIRPTEPPLLDNDSTVPTTLSEISTTEYRSYTKEEDEVLDFSDADKSSTYRPFNDLRATEPTVFIRSTTEVLLNTTKNDSLNIIKRVPTPNPLALHLNYGLKLSNSSVLQDIDNDESSVEDITESDDYFPFNTGEDEEDAKLKATAKPYGLGFKPENSTPISIAPTINYNNSKPADSLLPPFKISLLNIKEENSSVVFNDEYLQSAHSQSFVSRSNSIDNRKGKTVNTNVITTTEFDDATTYFTTVPTTTNVPTTTSVPTTNVPTTYEPTTIPTTAVPTTNIPTTIPTFVPESTTYETKYYETTENPLTTESVPTTQTTTFIPPEFSTVETTTDETTESRAVPNNHWSTSPEVTKLWESTLYVDPLIINRNLDTDNYTPTTYRPEYSTQPFRTTTEYDFDESVVDIRFTSTTDNPTSTIPTTTNVPTDSTDVYTTVIDLGIHSLLNSTELEIASSQAQQIFGNLKSTEQDILIEKMKEAESNSTVRRLILLLVSTCDASLSNNKTVQETRNSILHALLNVPSNTTPESSVENVEINSRHGKQLETTTFIATTTSIAETTKSSIIADIEVPNKIQDIKDVNHDTRALELLRSLYSLAAKWGKK